MAALQKGKDFSNLCAVLAVQALWNYFVILEPISLRKLELWITQTTETGTLKFWSGGASSQHPPQRLLSISGFSSMCMHIKISWFSISMYSVCIGLHFWCVHLSVRRNMSSTASGPHEITLIIPNSVLKHAFTTLRVLPRILWALLHGLWISDKLEIMWKRSSTASFSSAPADA